MSKEEEWINILLKIILIKKHQKAFSAVTAVVTAVTVARGIIVINAGMKHRVYAGMKRVNPKYLVSNGTAGG